MFTPINKIMGETRDKDQNIYKAMNDLNADKVRSKIRAGQIAAKNTLTYIGNDVSDEIKAKAKIFTELLKSIIIVDRAGTGTIAR